jgi:hypothetical protein
MATITVKKSKKAIKVKNEKAAGSRTPAAAMQAAQMAAPRASYTGFAVCAIIAFICFTVLLVLQWVEYTGYDKPIPAFLQPSAAVMP